ncbi:MAG: BatA domain-containing protein [Bacteroidales bacterium]
MRFNNFQYLYFAALTILPLIIYIIFKKKPEKIVFGSLYLLKDITKKINRKIRIKDIILLILRTLFVFLLILLFAEPFIGPETDHDAKKPTMSVAYIDTSPSMAEDFKQSTKLDRAKDMLIKIISASRAKDVFYFMTSDPHENFRGYKNEALKFVNDLDIYGREREFYSVYNKADSILFEKNDTNKMFLVLTDGKIKFTGPDPDSFEPNFISRAFIFKNSKNETGNVKILSAQTTGSSSLAIDLVSNEDREARLELFMDGERNYTKNITLEKDIISTKHIDISRKNNTASSVLIRTEGDANDLNNLYHTIIPEIEKKKILIIGDKGSYALKGLVSLSQSGRDSIFSLDIINPENINSVVLNDHDMILFNNMSEINSFSVSRLKSFLALSKSIYFIADNIDLNNYNSYLIPELGLPEITGQRKTSESFFRIKISDPAHPVFKNVFASESNVPGTVEIYNYYKVSKKNWKTIVESEGWPVMLEKNAYGGKLLMLTTGLEPEDSNIITNGIAVPMLYNSFLYLTGNEAGSANSRTVGDIAVFKKKLKKICNIVKILKEIVFFLRVIYGYNVIQ